MWYVYVVRCKRGALYTGIATDVEARVKLHNSGKGAKAVRALGLPVQLIYQEEAGSYPNALKREAQLKRLSKEEKEDLICVAG